MRGQGWEGWRGEKHERMNIGETDHGWKETDLGREERIGEE